MKIFPFIVVSLFIGVSLNSCWEIEKPEVVIYYEFNDSDATATVIKVDNYPDSLTIPREVSHANKTYKVTSIGDTAFKRYKSLTNIDIPNSVTNIEDGAFRGCVALTSINIPNSVTSIGDRAFAYCNSLTSIKVDKENQTYNDGDNGNCVIETATNRLIVGCQSTVIPSNVTSIGDGSFNGCETLKEITIPNGVTSIEDGAFAYCKSLASITIPNSMKSIGKNVFVGCSECVIKCTCETPPSALERSFSPSMTAVVPKNSISAYKKAEGWKVMSIKASEDLTD